MAILIIKPINLLFNYALLCKLNLAISYYSLNHLIHPHMLITVAHGRAVRCQSKRNYRMVIWFKIIRKVRYIDFIINFKSKGLIVARESIDTYNIPYLR
jgi:hypothetical protein